MATVLHDIPELLTVEEFLAIDFGERKVELNNGRIYMMAGGTLRHNRVSLNVAATLLAKLRGSGCMPYNSDTGLRPHDFSLRYPDVTVYCGNQIDDDEALFLRSPKAVFEILSAGTARSDLNVKLLEYRGIDSLDAIVFIDAVEKSVRVLHRQADRSWIDGPFAAVDIELPTLGISLTQDEIFARD